MNSASSLVLFIIAKWLQKLMLKDKLKTPYFFIFFLLSFQKGKEEKH